MVASHHLEPLDRGEVKAYIEHRLRQVGWQEDPRFEDQAYGMVCDYTEGVPRRINLVCSRLLVLGAIEERHVIDRAAVAEVLDELDQEGVPYEPLPAGDAAVAQDTEPGAGNGSLVHAAAGGAAESTVRLGDLEQWRKEVVRLLRKLERTYDDLAGERHRAECIRAEAEQLRAQLHRIEVERLRVDARGPRPVAEISKELAGRGTIFRRFVGG